MTKYYKIETYVPVAEAPRVREAITAAGAGKFGAYDRCVWETPGTGRFWPLEGSSPFIGRVGETEAVAELKIETFCAETALAAVITALKAAHPYEVPAVYIMETLLG